MLNKYLSEMTKKLSMTLKLSDFLSHWSGQSHQSCQLKQSALKNFSRGEKLPEFKLKGGGHLFLSS